MTLEELTANASVLIIAGSETIVTLLSAVTFLLCRTPNALRKLTQEVHSASARDDEIDLVNAQNLKSLQAVLEDSLGVYPPAASGQPRKIAAGGDSITRKPVNASHFSCLPERWTLESLYQLHMQTIVIIPQWASYHNHDYFKQPE